MTELASLAGRVALITGGASGQGRAAAKLFAEQGASDFPHPDALFPSAADTFIAAMPDASLPTVLWDAPMKFYRLETRCGLHVQR